MIIPKANRTAKRIIDCVHLLAASVWLGGFLVLFVLPLDGGEGLGLSGLDASMAVEAFRERFIAPCIPLLMSTAVLYGFFTSWGFAKHGWLVAKWALSVFVIVGFSVMPYSVASVGVALLGVATLFAISIFKPGTKRTKSSRR
ncbi:MAG: hypothetical protein ACLRX5_09330 [Slackia sp.]